MYRETEKIEKKKIIILYRGEKMPNFRWVTMDTSPICLNFMNIMFIAQSIDRSMLFRVVYLAREYFMFRKYRK